MALNTIQIVKKIKADFFARHYFKAVVPRDKLPRSVSYPCSFVVNTHSSKQPGEHWLAIHYDESGKCTFFDSFGLSPLYYKLDDFIKKTSTSWEHNEQQIQSISSNKCGYYCIYFILLMSRNLSLNEILSLFCKKDFDFNDFIIKFI